MKHGHDVRMPEARRAAGLSLIELMVAMLLGLLVVGAAIGIFLSNRQAYRTTESLGQVQETLQMAFELMARDVREAGGNPCDIGLPVANVVDNATTNWWTNWAVPLQGYDNGGPAGLSSVAGTDVLQVLAVGDVLANVVAHSGTTLTVDGASGIAAGDVVMVCDTAQLAIFKASGASATTIDHAASGGNCKDSLNTKPAACSDVPYVYPRNSVVSQLHGTRWFVADNGRGGRSLFRVVDNGAKEEMVEGVADMQLEYLLGAGAASYVGAAAVSDWTAVTAVRIALTSQSSEATGTGNAPLQRRLEHVVALRSRTI